MTSISPAFRYYGAKWKLGKKIVPIISQIKHRYFIEPYGGSAAITLQKTPSETEIFNDLCGEVCNFFRVLRDGPEDFLEAVFLTPYSREEWELSFEPSILPVERARRFLCRQTFSISTTTSRQSRSGFRNYFDKEKRNGPPPFQNWTKYPSNLRAVADRFSGLLVENLPALECIKKYDHPDSLFFIDPPYEHSTRSNPGEGYEHEMVEDDHRELAKVLNQIKGKAVITHYPHPIYLDGLADFKLISFEASAGFSGHSPRTECVWLSPNIKLLQMDLFQAESVSGGAA